MCLSGSVDRRGSDNAGAWDGAGGDKWSAASDCVIVCEFCETLFGETGEAGSVRLVGCAADPTGVRVRVGRSTSAFCEMSDGDCVALKGETGRTGLAACVLPVLTE